MCPIRVPRRDESFFVHVHSLLCKAKPLRDFLRLGAVPCCCVIFRVPACWFRWIAEKSAATHPGWCRSGWPSRCHASWFNGGRAVLLLRPDLLFIQLDLQLQHNACLLSLVGRWCVSSIPNSPQLCKVRKSPRPVWCRPGVGDMRRVKYWR